MGIENMKLYQNIQRKTVFQKFRGPPLYLKYAKYEYYVKLGKKVALCNLQPSSDLYRFWKFTPQLKDSFTIILVVLFVICSTEEV